MTNFPIPTCFHCGSELVKLSEDKETLGNQQSETITIAYKCSDAECQAQKDKRAAEAAVKRKELKDREEARAKDQAEKKALAAAIIAKNAEDNPKTKKSSESK